MLVSVNVRATVSSEFCRLPTDTGEAASEKWRRERDMDDPELDIHKVSRGTVGLMVLINQWKCTCVAVSQRLVCHVQGVSLVFHGEFVSFKFG